MLATASLPGRWLFLFLGYLTAESAGNWQLSLESKIMATKPKQPDLKPSVPGGSDAVVLERKAQRVEPPKMFQVVLLNDDFTPMEFVVLVLQEYFNKDRETATQIMLKIHVEGRGICGVFTRDVATTKVEQVLQAARHAGHPLQCLSEPVE